MAATARAKLTAVDLPEAEVDKCRYTLIPPGRYELRFTRHETAVMFGRAPKLLLWFNVITCGEHFEKEVPRFYNVKSLIGKPGRGGRFKAKAGGDFIMDYYNLFQPAKRLDRISFDPWRTNIIMGNVDTVVLNADQKNLPDALRYSVIRSFSGLYKP